MTGDIISGLTSLAKTYKTIGGKFLKGTAVELFIDTYHDEIVRMLAEGLALIPPENIPKIIHDKLALPIPPAFFEYLKGFEDYLDGFDPGRLFELISEANPLIAAAIIDQGEEGANYMVRFKAFVLDSVRDIKEAEPEPEVAEEKTKSEVRVKQAPHVSVDEEESGGQLYQVPHLRATVASEDNSTPPEGKTETQKPKLPERPAEGMARLHCDQCDESWDVPQGDLSSVTECPFCHAPS